MTGNTSFQLPEHCKQLMGEISQFFVSSDYKDLKLIFKGEYYGLMYKLIFVDFKLNLGQNF